MRFKRTDLFKADYKRLPEVERDRFRAAARAFNAACDRFARSRDPAVWPASLRVKPVTGASGIFEMTWSFSGPDGRATWEPTTVADAHEQQWPAVRWRRLGDHRIFRDP